MIGCDPENPSYGRITDIQVFDRILTADEMVGMTTCSGKNLAGNLINTNTDPFTLYGEEVKQVWVNQEMICPVRNFSAVFLDTIYSTLSAREICKNLNRDLVSVTSQEDLDNINFFLK